MSNNSRDEDSESLAVHVCEHDLHALLTMHLKRYARFIGIPPPRDQFELGVDAGKAEAILYIASKFNITLEVKHA